MDLELPLGLTSRDEAFPVFFLDTQGADPLDPGLAPKLGRSLAMALGRAHPEPVSGQALIKVHIGEPKCTTRMRPEFCKSSVEFLKARSTSALAFADSTVAYTGPRGYRENPSKRVDQYLELARGHGWSASGPAGADFLVLDRPCSSGAGGFIFHREQECQEVAGVNRFKDFFMAGGFAAADLVVNHAHLTLHGLAGVAGCVKSVAMGCSSLKGKLRMHQSLIPHFDKDLCLACGICRDSCPQGALSLSEEDPPPMVEPDSCIGCGECEAVCTQRAVSLKGMEITDWQRGEDTLAGRMADYVLGLMNRRWQSTIHVLHLYNLTARCDCLDRRQKPLIAGGLGFLISKNPFALDRIGARFLREAVERQGVEAEMNLIQTAGKTATYVKNQYGIVSDPQVITLTTLS